MAHSGATFTQTPEAPELERRVDELRLNVIYTLVSMYRKNHGRVLFVDSIMHCDDVREYSEQHCGGGSKDTESVLATLGPTYTPELEW